MKNASFEFNKMYYLMNFFNVYNPIFTINYHFLCQIVELRTILLPLPRWLYVIVQSPNRYVIDNFSGLMESSHMPKVVTGQIIPIQVICYNKTELKRKWRQHKRRWSKCMWEVEIIKKIINQVGKDDYSGSLKLNKFVELVQKLANHCIIR